MAAIDFPNSPSNNDVFSDAGTTWRYASATGTWTVIRDSITGMIPDASIEGRKLALHAINSGTLRPAVQAKKFLIIAASGEQTVTWAEAFADTDYAVVATIMANGSTAAADSSGIILSNKSKTGITVSWAGLNGTGPSSPGEINMIAMVT